MTNEFEWYKEDFLTCKKIIQQHSKSFYAAFSQLPKEKAWSIFAVYAFCRKADDLIDKHHDITGLLKLEQELQAFATGHMPNQAMWRALSVVFQNYDMPIQPFFDMLEGQKQDETFTQPETQAELIDYCYYVAGSVGLMLLPILSKNWRKITAQAKKMGEAMQLTNILRDIGEDFDNNRIYLPQEVLTKFGVSKRMLQQKKVTDEFIAAWEFEAHIAEKSYQNGLTMLPLIDQEARKAVVAASFFYRELLTVIRKKNYAVLTTRQKVSRQRKLTLLPEIARIAAEA